MLRSGSLSSSISASGASEISAPGAYSSALERCRGWSQFRLRLAVDSLPAIAPVIHALEESRARESFVHELSPALPPCLHVRTGAARDVELSGLRLEAIGADCPRRAEEMRMGVPVVASGWRVHRHIHRDPVPGDEEVGERRG